MFSDLCDGGVATRAFLATCLHVCSSRHNSPPWTDHCLGHHIGSLLAQLSFVDHCFGWPILPIAVITVTSGLTTQTRLMDHFLLY